MTTTDTTTTLPLAPGRRALDTLHTDVSFAIRHLGLAKVRGRFTHVEATLDVGEAPEDVRVTATVYIDSIDTGNADRDAHVLQDDILDVAKRPTMTFTSTRITGSGADWVMEGALTIGDVSRPARFDVEFSGTSDAMGDLRAGFSMTGQVSRKDYGLSFGPMAEAGLGDVVKFEVDLEFIAPAPAGVGPADGAA
jgi:polyisoprenoid-binding protein YceI